MITYLSLTKNKIIHLKKYDMAAPTIQFPLNDVQMSLLKLTENLPQEDLQALKQIGRASCRERV